MDPIPGSYMEEFKLILRKLEEKGVEYIVVGGFAVVLHGLPRMTQDVDLFVELLPENIAKLKTALNELYRDDSIKEISLEDLETNAVLRYGTPTGFVIDIMSRIGEAFTFRDLESTLIDLDGSPVRVATPETLIKMKQGTLRPKDGQDVLFLQRLLASRNGE